MSVFGRMNVVSVQPAPWSLREQATDDPGAKNNTSKATTASALGTIATDTKLRLRGERIVLRQAMRNMIPATSSGDSSSA